MSEPTLISTFKKTFESVLLLYMYIYRIRTMLRFLIHIFSINSSHANLLNGVDNVTGFDFFQKRVKR